MGDRAHRGGAARRRLRGQQRERRQHRIRNGSGGGGAAGGGNLVVGTIEVPSSIDPANVYEKFASDVLFNTTNRLVEYPPGATEPEPGLATEWDISDDGLTYTFTLREGVKFQDGSDFDSEDVKYSLERAINVNDPDGASFLLQSRDEETRRAGRGHREHRGDGPDHRRHHPRRAERHLPLPPQLHGRLDRAERRRLQGARRGAHRRRGRPARRVGEHRHRSSAPARTSSRATSPASRWSSSASTTTGATPRRPRRSPSSSSRRRHS